jgi:hypothetical protein
MLSGQGDGPGHHKEKKMYTTITTALADEHVKDMRTQATANARVRQAREARKEQRAHGTIRHEFTTRRRHAAARHA